MATDFAFDDFSLPVLVGIGLLAAIALLARRTPAGVHPFLSLGAKRIACGYLGALGALLVYSVVNSVLLGFSKIQLGHVTPAEMPAMVSGWSIHLFVLLAPFVVAVVTIVGLPLMYFLSRMGLASVLGAALAATVYAIAKALMTYGSPYNPWCAGHVGECVAKSFADSLTIALTVAVGFALAARLPLLDDARTATSR